MQKSVPLFVALFVVAFAGRPLVAAADTTAEDAKDYRSALMTSLRGHIVAASMHVRGLVEDHGFLAAHAEGLANGARELQHVFPAGSNVNDSEALPVIWEQPEEFRKAVEAAQAATAAFSEAVAGGDKSAIGKAFRDVGAACRGCHDNFRVDND
ncbi:MAG: cytochrome c [Woeseia sp.]